MSDAPVKVDPAAVLVVGGLAAAAAGVAVAAYAGGGAPESSDELAERLVEGSLRRGDAHRPWYAAAERGGANALSERAPSSVLIVHDGERVLDTFTSDDRDAVRAARDYPWVVLDAEGRGGLNALGDDGVLGEAFHTISFFERHPGVGVGIAVGLSLAAAAGLAWAFWPVTALTADEQAALAAAAILVVPPGRPVCPASPVALEESAAARHVLGWDRYVLLHKEGWRFFSPASVLHAPAAPAVQSASIAAATPAPPTPLPPHLAQAQRAAAQAAKGA